jgi:hypothetical protein
MAELKYGHVEGPGRGREYPTAASQTFYRRGGKFVVLRAGNITLCASNAATIAGWAITPKDAEGYTYWTSSATAEADKLFVIFPSSEDVFEMPHSEATVVAASQIGWSARIKIESGVQYFEVVNTAASSVLNIVDVDSVNNTAFVKVNPGNLIRL